MPSNPIVPPDVRKLADKARFTLVLDHLNSTLTAEQFDAVGQSFEQAIMLDRASRLPTDGDGVVRPEAYTVDQLARLTFAIYYSTALCAPENIAAEVKAIDCCPGCEHTSSSGSTCYRFERGEHCPNQLAETLREISAALYGTPGLSSYRDEVWGPGAEKSFLPLAIPRAPKAEPSEEAPPAHTLRRWRTDDRVKELSHDVAVRWFNGEEGKGGTPRDRLERMVGAAIDAGIDMARADE